MKDISFFRKTLILTTVLVALGCVNPTPAQANPVLIVIKKGVVKVIKAVDLMIQRMQNKVIWLQNAQRTIENKLSELGLQDIARWTQRQRDLYRDYFDELHKVRTILQTYKQVRLIIKRQQQLRDEYAFTWRMVNHDPHFTREEIDFMYRVYTGIIEESLYNIEQLHLVITSFRTQMSDAKRLKMIKEAGEGIEQNYSDLQEFNRQNIQLSMQRAKGDHEIEAVRRLYGIQTP